ncbi:MAG: hypothetical protein K0Q73_7204 [Paenibacillus sp.]|jgi:hypothetical protein|nr:hypothetical protein [Paenibacillus sp.]
MENMKIYEQVREVPKEALKPISGGRLKGMSDINPMWRIKMLTEMFGICGIGWKVEITDKRLERGEGVEVVCFVDINLYVKVDGEWSAPIPGMGGSSFVTQERNGPFTSDECFKMAYTDAISVACKSLGFAADVYFANDRTKYTKPEEEPKQDIPPASLKAKYQLGKGDMNGFEEWVVKMQAEGHNYKTMEQVLAERLLKKAQEIKEAK